MGINLDSSSWKELKRELMAKWYELTENDLESTRGNSTSIVKLLEEKVGLAIEEANEKFAEIASRYHLHDEPEESEHPLKRNDSEEVMELRPKSPAGRKEVPRDDWKH